MHLAESHLGNDFHIYELLWMPSGISLSIDGINYGSLGSALRESAMTAKIKSAVNWASNGPFDKEVNAIYSYAHSIMENQKCHQL
jgi:hypothetical protein